MARRAVRGNFRSLIKRLPETVAEELRAQLHESGKMLLARARARVPKRTGALSAGLSYKVPPKRLNLKVGLIGKAINRKLYYGRMVEFGRKGQTVDVVRGGLSASVRAAGGRSNRYKALALRMGAKGAYKLRVKPMAPRHYVYATAREQIYRPFQKIWGRAVHRAATGATNE